MADKTYQVIRDQCRDKLLSITEIQEVARYPKREFTGYPAAILAPADGDSEWETNNEHERVYAFNCEIFYETKGIGNDEALDRLMEIADLILDEFAEDTELQNPTPIALPTKKTLITVDPVFAGWEEVDDTELIKVTILIKVIVSCDVT